MDKRQFIKYLQEYLEVDAFKMLGKDKGSVSLLKENKEIIITYSKYPSQFLLPPALIGHLCFPEIENVLEKYFASNNLNYTRSTIFCQSRRCEDLNLRTIEEPEDFKAVIPLYKKMVIEDIIPFFEKYSSIENVERKISDLSQENLSKFVYSPIHPRIMIIKRLMDASDWETYCEKTIDMYREQSEGKYKAVFAPIYHFLPELFHELKNFSSPRST